MVLKCFTSTNFFTFHDTTLSTEKTLFQVVKWLARGSHSKQVTEQSFEAGLSTPGSMQRTINQDPDAFCPVISAEDKHPRINVIKTRREEIRSGWNQAVYALPGGWGFVTELQSTWVWGVELYTGSLFWWLYL